VCDLQLSPVQRSSLRARVTGSRASVKGPLRRASGAPIRGPIGGPSGAPLRGLQRAPCRLSGSPGGGPRLRSCIFFPGSKPKRNRGFSEKFSPGFFVTER
jgi:hypothetical protein